MKSMNHKLIILGLCLFCVGKIVAMEQPNGRQQVDPQPQQANPALQGLAAAINQPNRPQPRQQEPVPGPAIVIPAEAIVHCLRETRNTVAAGALGAAVVCSVHTCGVVVASPIGISLGGTFVGLAMQTPAYVLAAGSLSFLAPAALIGGLGGASIYVLGKPIYKHFFPGQQQR